jgi:hypothetical protein
MSFGHALYYPYIHLTNKNWLKYALLYWDKISRIVPVSVNPSDSEDIITIKSEIGFIEDYAPDSWDTSNTMRKFLERFHNDIDELHHIGRYSSYKCRHHDDFNRIRKHRIFSLERSVNLSSSTYIHVQKIEPRLVEMLFEMDLAEPGENEWESYIKVEGIFGYLYMTYLANTISEKNNIPIITDLEDFFITSQYFKQRKSLVNQQIPKEFEFSLANMLIADYFPKDINLITIDKIIKIRKELEGQRISFANEIISLANRVKSEIGDESSLQDALNHYSESLKSQCEEIRKIYESFGIDTIINFLTVSVPTSIITLSSNFIQSEYRPIAIGGGILLGLAATANKMRIRKQELDSKPLSYLLKIQSKVTGENFLNKISDRFKGIFA